MQKTTEHDERLLKEVLDGTLKETKAMIAHDPSPEGRRAALTHALTEPSRKIEALLQGGV